jgi:predicted nucleic acid-binding protein
VLLDTSFRIDLLNGDEAAVEKARELEADLVQQRRSAMTLFELYYGITRTTDSEAERETVESVLASKPVHPADTAVMRTAGRLAGDLQNEGRRRRRDRRCPGQNRRGSGAHPES